MTHDQLSWAAKVWPVVKDGRERTIDEVAERSGLERRQAIDALNRWYRIGVLAKEGIHVSGGHYTAYRRVAE